MTTDPAELVKLAGPRMKAIYDKLAAEGGGTWATWMMIDIEEAFAASRVAAAHQAKECAQVKLRGAAERLLMVVEHRSERNYGIAVEAVKRALNEYVSGDEQ